MDQDTSQALLPLWRRTRDPRFAELLDRAAERSSQREVPTLERAIRACVVPGVGSLRDVGARAAARCIADAPSDDPRVSTALIRVLEAPVFLFAMRPENGVREFWDLVMNTLTASHDVRAVSAMTVFATRVRSLTTAGDEEAEEDMYTAHALGPYLHHHMPLRAQKLEASLVIQPLTPEQQGALEDAEREYAAEIRQHDQRLRTRNARAAESLRLRWALSERPDSDEPRLAYAEFLRAESAESPRAAFIQLQVDRARGEEWGLWDETELRGEYETEWLGGVAHVVESPVFERGFVVECTLYNETHANLLGARELADPLWALVRRLTSLVDDAWTTYDVETKRHGANQAMLTLVADMAGRSLVDLDGVSVAGLCALVQQGHTSFQCVTLDSADEAFSHQSDPDHPTLANAPANPVADALRRLTALHTLRLRVGCGDDDEVIRLITECRESHGESEEPICQHLEVLLPTYRSVQLSPAFMAVLAECGVPTVSIKWTSLNPDATQDACELSVTRDAEGRLSEVRAILHPRVDPTVFLSPQADQFFLVSFRERLADFAPDAVRSFSLVHPRDEVSALPSEAGLAKLSAELERFDALERIQLLPPGDSAEGIAALVAELESDLTRPLALSRLGSFQHPEARHDLMRFVGPEAEPHTRVMALEAAAPVVERDCVPALRAALDDTAAGCWAARLLGFLGATEVTEELADYSRTQPGWVQERIAEALARLADAGATPATRSALLELYDAQPSDALLLALARARVPETLALARAAVERGEHEALAALAFVADHEDLARFDEHIASETRVRFVAGIPSIAKMCVDPGVVTKAEVDALRVHMKSWSAGLSEFTAWLLLELHQRLGVPRPKIWGALSSAVADWTAAGDKWSKRAWRKGMSGAEWNYWDVLRAEVRDTWQ